jgi:hypothetical protein
MRKNSYDIFIITTQSGNGRKEDAEESGKNTWENFKILQKLLKEEDRLQNTQKSSNGDYPPHYGMKHAMLIL